MLAYLRVRNLAVLRDVEATFGPGFNALTGETGAGKSILVDAVGLLLGDRADAGLIRAGEKDARVEGQFYPVPDEVRELLEREGMPPPDEDGLLVCRELRTDGPNRVFINGGLASLAGLRALMARQVALHGQNTHLTLAEHSERARCLEGFGELADCRLEVEAAWKRLDETAVERQRHESSGAEREARIAVLRHQLGEIESCRPVEGEQSRLEARERLLGTVAERVELTDRLVARLVDDEAALSAVIAHSSADLERLAELDARVGDEVARLREVALIVDDIAAAVRGVMPGDDLEPAELERVQERLAVLQSLCLKYGSGRGDLVGVLRYEQEAGDALEALVDFDSALEQWRRRESEAAQEFHARAVDLSGRRKKAASRLARAVSKELAGVGLEQSRFEVRVNSTLPSGARPDVEDIRAAAARGGYDTVDFLFAANPGEEVRPMVQVASGGELARLMLALQLVLKNQGDGAGPGTFIFDEIDAGVGGEQAGVLGRRLQGVAEGRQVICVTHLPQVAALADRQLLIAKRLARGRAVTSLKELEPAERVKELARMLGNDDSPETAARHAAALMRPREGAARSRSRRGRAAASGL